MSTLNATNHTVTPEVIHGTAGNDLIMGGAGNDTIHAGDGDDHLFDEEGTNQLMGGAGNDSIIGTGIINGGPGNDEIAAAGDASGNVYQYAPGDGQDQISTSGDQATVAGQGVLQFSRGISPDSVMLARERNDLIVYISATDHVTLLNWFDGPAFQLEKISFSDGTVWRPADITTKDIGILGTANDDFIEGYASNNLIHAGPGDDYVFDDQGNNIIYGGGGDDALVGRGVFDGGAGNDTLMAAGDAEHNVYFHDIGDGRDTLYAHGDANPGRAQGTVAFGANLKTSELWFSKDGNDLAVTQVGSCEGITIKDWYLGAPNQVAHFLSGDYRMLTNDKVDTLVQAMANFTPPASTDGGPAAAIPQALAPVLAASWT